MTTQQFKVLSHCTFSLQYHLVLVTKYRKKCLTNEMLIDLKAICKKQLELKEGALLEFNAEEDHIHLLFELPPKTSISTLINILKTSSARLLRKNHHEHLQKFFLKPILWSRSYFVVSCGGAPLAVIKKYIQQQKTPH
ncbi:IS200/IS605 family transposase [Limnohabitans sp. 2KL-51]|uniref:IS200/IS605 family transposase n=1 Tax=Limnohabitans sp. 2KL-51 TaxID=1977911 RepID=UPI000D3635A8|nr:IS200/IS605 family transposase [Limnohabitans sp. 2KL-51]PUE44344.1 hypothetical protein B9Z49_19740 [Limnohabitans sp. 2KL-51]